MADQSFYLPVELVEALRKARQVAVLTGAGISAESGLATFRDKMTGLWANYNPQELANAEAFRRNPKLVWDWYAWRREQVLSAKPNPGHLALVEMEKHVPQFDIFTQNVDGLHQDAGSHRVIELHGNIRRFKCFDENVVVDSWQDNGEVPPRCPNCGGLLRPNVVWFGEALPFEALQLAVQAAQTCDVFFSIGTSGVVEPAASLPRLAARNGAIVVTVNLEVENRNGPLNYAFNGKAGEILPVLVGQAWPNY